MNKSEVLKQIKETGVIPVVRATTADEAMRAIDAIREGGIAVLEITMTVPGAVGVIEQVAARFGTDALVGELRGDTVQVFVYPTGDVCSNVPIMFRLVRVGKEVKVAQANSACLDAR